MTTGINLDKGGELRDWARAELGIDFQTTSADARRRILSELGEFDFVPPSAWQFGLRAAGLGGRCSPANANTLCLPLDVAVPCGLNYWSGIGQVSSRYDDTVRRFREGRRASEGVGEAGPRPA